MTTIRKSLSTRSDAQGHSRILLRVTFNHNTQVRLKTDIYIPTKRWDKTKERISIGRSTGSERTDLIESTTRLKDLEIKILRLSEIYPPQKLTKQWLEQTLTLCADTPAQQLNRQLISELTQKQQATPRTPQRTIFELLDDYLADTKYSKKRENGFRTLSRILQRYQWYVRLSSKQRCTFTLDINTITKETIGDIESFLRNEHTLLAQHPKIFQRMPCNTDNRNPIKPRGNNTICAQLNRLRAFLNWCVENNLTTNRPFIGYNGTTTEKYGTPYYITLEERNHIADFDLSAHPRLAIHRDIFIFQCCVGCRVSDLTRLTPADIIDGEIHYIPHKTKGKAPVTVHVPLNKRAKALVQKYKGVDKSGRLFPFRTPQIYNRNIKKLLRLCGVTRMVTIIISATGEEKKRPICDLATSHMARRCFIGNLYKRWADPSVICPMSGHKAGSTAFARYREIDKELRMQVIKSIE